MNRSRLTVQLKFDEGSKVENGRHYAYTDSESYLTIGYGKLIDRIKGGGLSDEEAEYLLDNDIDRIQNQAIREFPWYNDLNDVRQECILNMCFNLGLNGLKRFKLMIKALERHDYTEASREMLDSRWSGQVGNRALRLSEAMRLGEW